MAKLPQMDFNGIRKTAIIAVFSDEYFFERVVLKGGNALAIVSGNRTWTTKKVFD
jgi:hypothetical protein